MSIETLRRIAIATSAGEPIAPADAEWLSSVIRDYVTLAPDGMTLDRVAGLVPEPGGESWWCAERRGERDDLLRQYAERFLPAGLSEWRRATALAADLQRYDRRVWSRDRRSSQMPASYSGTPAELLYKIFRASTVAPPLSAKHLLRVFVSH